MRLTGICIWTFGLTLLVFVLAARADTYVNNSTGASVYFGWDSTFNHGTIYEATNGGITDIPDSDQGAGDALDFGIAGTWNSLANGGYQPVPSLGHQIDVTPAGELPGGDTSGSTVDGMSIGDAGVYTPPSSGPSLSDGPTDMLAMVPWLGLIVGAGIGIAAVILLWKYSSRVVGGTGTR